MKIGKTSRGFKHADFQDRYGEKCSIQESSLATEAALWLGIDDPEIKVMEPGKGWTDKSLEKLFPGRTTLISGRMHLTVPMVRELLPLLQHFVEHGELPD